MLFDAQEHRSRALEYSRLASQTESRARRDHFLRMAYTSLLLAKNADWIKSTDEFLRKQQTRSGLYSR